MRDVEVTASNIGDAPMLPELLDQIPPDKHIRSVTADGASDMRRYHNAIVMPAIMPSFPNAKTPNRGSLPIPAPAPETKRSIHSGTWTERTGDSGADTAAETGQKPNCIV